MMCAVSQDEVERLSRRFKKLDLDSSGAISITEFRTVLPELQDNPLVSRVVSIFDTDGNGELDFQGLLRECNFTVPDFENVEITLHYSKTLCGLSKNNFFKDHYGDATKGQCLGMTAKINARFLCF